MAKKPTSMHAIINELVDRTNSDIQRLRVLEQRNDILTSRSNVIEKEILNINRNIQRTTLNMETINKKTEERINKNDAMLREVVKQIKKLATTSKIIELEQLIEIYQSTEVPVRYKGRSPEDDREKTINSKNRLY